MKGICILVILLLLIKTSLLLLYRPLLSLKERELNTESFKEVRDASLLCLPSPSPPSHKNSFQKKSYSAVWPCLANLLLHKLLLSLVELPINNTKSGRHGGAIFCKGEDTNLSGPLACFMVILTYKVLSQRRCTQRINIVIFCKVSLLNKDTSYCDWISSALILILSSSLTRIVAPKHQ